MINLVGINKIHPLNTELSKKINFSLNVNLEETEASIAKLTSVMCTASSIELEKSSTGILISTTYTIKVLYTSLESESVHVWKTTYTHLTEIESFEKIGWDSLNVLIKRKKLYPKAEIYEIFSKKLTNKSFYLTIYALLRIDYAKPLSLCLNIMIDKSTSNLFLTDENFKDLEQITFQPLGLIKSPIFDTTLPVLYFFRKNGDSYFLENYNLKTKSFNIISEDFLSIFEFKVLESFILIYGETAFAKGIFKINKNDFEIEILHQSINITKFSYTNNVLYTLEETDNSIFLNSISNEIFSKNHSLKLDCLDGIFIENFLIFLDKDKNLNLLNLENNTSMQILKNSNIKTLSTVLINYPNIYVHFNITEVEAGILSYNIKEKSLKYLLNKKANIKSISFNKEKTKLYFSLKTHSNTEIYTLEENKITKLIKLSAEDIFIS
ncbi:MAG: hypothetical protein ACRC28_03625 [Clostridium sp.]|uniref:hypothetical protein n=1 Tax=Clostridium sp. TaxID=1506 RepID=UPI003F38EC2A